MIQFLSYLVNGIGLGSVYAIIALGYSMVYGIAKMLNFAHGDVIMIGAYISFCATQYWGLPPAVSVLAAMVVCTVLGVVIEGLAYKPLRQASSLAVLITAIGSALAAIAGVLLCSTYPVLMPTTGSMPGIKAFTAAVFGGIGSIPGALLGGVLLGIIEILGKAYVSTELGDALVFGVLIIVLLVKPTGLLGKKIHEKV